MKLPAAQRDRIVDRIRREWIDLQAIYGFGSRVQGFAHVDSDLDLAFLRPDKVDAMSLFRFSDELAEIAGCAVDLVDLRGASTVMQHQIITTGQRWWAKHPEADLFEVMVLKEMLSLEEGRAGLLSDIAKRGTVYGG